MRTSTSAQTRIVASAPLAALILIGSGCSKSNPQDEVTFAANSPIQVSVILQTADGQSGGSSPIRSNPQVRFANSADDNTCTVTLPASADALEPGQTLDVSLTCDANATVSDKAADVKMIGGGKQVVHGTVQLPPH